MDRQIDLYLWLSVIWLGLLIVGFTYIMLSV
jgi:hypothetical protein